MKHTKENGCKFEMRDFFLNKEKVKRNYCFMHDVFVCDRCDGSFADHYSGGMWACAFNPSKNIDISKYKSVTEFHDAIRDSEYTAPPEMYRCLVKLMDQKGFTFQEAYNFLWERKLIFISGNFYFYDLKANKLWE